MIPVKDTEPKRSQIKSLEEEFKGSLIQNSAL